MWTHVCARGRDSKPDESSEPPEGTAVPGTDAGAPSPSPAPRAAASALSNVRVLVVDDAPDVLFLTSTILRRHGASVKAVDSAAQALAVIEDFQPDVIVSDICMPECDGFDLIREIRAHAAATVRDVPAAALTAHIQVGQRELAYSAGFQEHMAKPIEPGSLVSTVASLVRSGARSLG